MRQDDFGLGKLIAGIIGLFVILFIITRIVVILDASAVCLAEVTNAEAQARKVILAAEAERDSNLARASGELAVGKARAEVKKLESISLYEGEAGGRRANVDIKRAQAELMVGLLNKIDILPERAFVKIGEAGGVLISISSDSMEK
jgi:hypothetical protein